MNTWRPRKTGLAGMLKRSAPVRTSAITSPAATGRPPRWTGSSRRRGCPSRRTRSRRRRREHREGAVAKISIRRGTVLMPDAEDLVARRHRDVQEPLAAVEREPFAPNGGCSPGRASAPPLRKVRVAPAATDPRDRTANDPTPTGSHPHRARTRWALRTRSRQRHRVRAHIHAQDATVPPPSRGPRRTDPHPHEQHAEQLPPRHPAGRRSHRRSRRYVHPERRSWTTGRRRKIR